MTSTEDEASGKDRREEFEELWKGPDGFGAWFCVVNNQRLGKRFMLTAFSFFVAGGVLALLMRIQLTVPENTFMGPQVYNQLFTMHGSTMMYLFAVPFLEGLALYLLPLMIGSRDVCFPRLTAFSFWVYLFGGIVFYSSFLVGMIPDAGWFAYTPLSGPEYAGKGLDFWLLGLAMVEIAGLAAGVEIVVTILKLRAPGMTLDRMPIFVWTMLVVGIMIMFAFTTLLVATALLELDRAAGTRFFDPQFGGNSLLWQHLFWFFGHPEVYIMFLPATGVVSMIVATFARRPLYAYSLVVMAIMLTGFVSFGLWMHHMYTSGLPELGLSFFAAASLMIGVASGIQVFAWIGTLWGTGPKLDTPLLYVLGFLFIFVLGGFTGVMIAVVPFDWQVHDTFFIVAHFHYVLIGGVLFPIFAGLHYWLPKITGRMMAEGLGKWSFWLTFVGFNLTFFPMHIMGFLGLPRRVYTYPEMLEIGGYNIVATVGAFIMAAGFVVIVVNLGRSLLSGEEARENPWQGRSLEWTTSSPPPVFSFYRLPYFQRRGRDWKRGTDSPDEVAERATAALAGAPLQWRATLSTDPLSARPQSVQYLAGPSNAPILAALGLLVAFLGVLVEWYLLLPLGLIYTAGILVRWLHPSEKQLKLLRESDVPKRAGLPVFVTGPDSIGWWGMLGLLSMCVSGFAVLFYCYFYLWLFSDQWPQGGIRQPDLPVAAVSYLILAAAGGAVFVGRRSFAAARPRRASLLLAGAAALGLLFIALQGFHLYHLDFRAQTNAYGSIFHVISWTLLLFAAVGIIMIGSALQRLRKDGHDIHGSMALQMQLTGMFWNFNAGAAVAVFAVLYLSPRLFG
jgi:cytochrome c oxidase subunit I+III